MEFSTCEKGHIYDPSINPTCPICAAEAAKAGGVSSIGATEPIGATTPVSATAPIGATTPVGATMPSDFGSNSGYGRTEPLFDSMNRGVSMPETRPVTNAGFSNSDFASPIRGYGDSGPLAVEGYGRTVPVTPANGPAGFAPVVGWLVCIDGPDKGKDYRIHNGNNYIGRAQHMDICIRNDEHISSVNAGVLGFDDVECVFFFGPAGGRNTVRVNGKMVINAVELNPYDRIIVGTTELMFVPLCGEKFSWNGKKES